MPHKGIWISPRKKWKSRGGILKDLHFRNHRIYGGWAEKRKEQRQLRITVGEIMKAWTKAEAKKKGRLGRVWGGMCRTPGLNWKMQEGRAHWTLIFKWMMISFKLSLTELPMPLLVSIFFIPSQRWFYLYSCLWQITWELFTSLFLLPGTSELLANPVCYLWDI